MTTAEEKEFAELRSELTECIGYLKMARGEVAKKDAALKAEQEKVAGRDATIAALSTDRTALARAIDPRSETPAAERSTESLIAWAEGERAQAAAMRKALVFIKEWFANLENGLGADDPLTAIRKRYHAPVHAQIDAALKPDAGEPLLKELRTLRIDNDRLEGLAEAQDKAIGSLTASRETLLADHAKQLAAYRKALDEYGAHGAKCASWKLPNCPGNWKMAPPCDCGLRAILQSPDPGKVLLAEHAAELAEAQRVANAAKAANASEIDAHRLTIADHRIELAALRRRAEAAEATVTLAREEIRALRQERKGEVWFWQGDDEDRLESLTCPVLIPADALRELLAARREREV